jgi:heme-degrading monooxygenase HmoA
MGDYYSMRVWQLKAGASAAELETLAATGVAEMHRWIPGVKQLALMRTEPGEASEPGGAQQPRYLMLTTFTSYEAYKAWRRVEEEGPDYWERYASVFMHWEQMARLVEEYNGELIDLKQSAESNAAPG